MELSMTPTPDHPRVLIAETDDVARLFLADNLAADHYDPVCAADSSTAIALLARHPDVLLVDVNGDTLGVIDAVRGETRPGVDSQLPILVLTSHDDELHRTRLFERGADDVLGKPYSYPELRARLGALLRRAHARQTPRVLCAGTLRVDVDARRVWVGETEVKGLRLKEYQLLLALIAQPERVFTRAELLRSVWGFHGEGHTRTLDSHAARLRSRLRVGEQRFVTSSWGVGYRLT
jgi:DNA-binding response OmpR family regulator